jgi:hypothetical protein
MCRLLVPVGLVVSLLISGLVGCNSIPIIGPNNKKDRVDTPGPPPDAASLVKFLNENAARVQAVQCTRLAINCKEGSKQVGLDGFLVCRKPLDFRLRANVLGSPAVDIGSNREEFWYWIKQANPPYRYHCRYSDLATGRVDLPFPFQPEMIVSALGIAEYDPQAKYEVRSVPNAHYLELIETTTSPQGQPMQRVTAFNKTRVTRDSQPQVVGYSLRDAKGKTICQASVREVQKDPGSGAVLPYRVVIEWPTQQVTMDMTLPGLQTTAITEPRAAKLFQASDLATYESFDLARRVIDSPGGVRRAGGTVPSGVR